MQRELERAGLSQVLLAPGRVSHSTSCSAVGKSAEERAGGRGRGRHPLCLRVSHTQKRLNWG